MGFYFMSDKRMRGGGGGGKNPTLTFEPKELQPDQTYIVLFLAKRITLEILFFLIL